MGRSAPLFNKIIETNQLIKGRLNVNNSDLKKLYTTLQRDDQRLINKKAHHEKMIKTQISKCNDIKFERKRIHESLQKSFNHTQNKVSLLYKNQGGTYYIKSRFYWEGKQREVQVGSIPIVIEIINTLIINNILTDMKQVKTNNISWDQINKCPALVDAVKLIASLKAQEYILRRLLASKLNVMGKTDGQKEDKSQIKAEEMHHKSSDSNYPNDEGVKSIEGVEWYEKWRKDNL